MSAGTQPLTKPCTMCKIEKKLEDFHTSKGGAHGRRSTCKLCVKNGPRHDVSVTEQTCSNCHVVKPSADFSLNWRNKTGLEWRCRTCLGLKKKKIRDWLDSKRQGQKCVQCGEDRWKALDFAHIKREDKAKRHNGRTREIGRLGCVEAMEREFVKTKFLCAFCHRIETKKENDEHKATVKTQARLRTDRVQAIVNAEKLKREHCIDCKRVVTIDTCCGFDFDHRDGTIKVNDVSALVCSAAVHRVVEEMTKCDLRCATCHRLATVQRGQQYFNKKRKRGEGNIGHLVSSYYPSNVRS